VVNHLGWGIGGVAALLAVVGCATVIGAETRSLEWCLQSANATHAFCDDFDHADAGSTWSAKAAGPSATAAQVPSDDSPPSAFSFKVAQTGGGAVAGLEKDFDQSFEDVKVELDLRLPSSNTQVQGNTQVGFLILEANSNSAPGFCLAMSVGNGGMFIVLLPGSNYCVSVANVGPDSGTGLGGMDAGGDAAVDGGTDGGSTFFVPHQIAGFVVSDEWLHMKLEVVRNADGSGTITFKLAGPGSYEIPALPPGSLPMDATVSLGIAATTAMPAGTQEIQFDNVTVDFPGQ
jgi:hypothetical protein